MAKRTRSVGPDATEVLGALHAIGMIVDSLKERLLIPINGLDASNTEETPRRGKRGPYKRRTKKRRPMTEAEKKRLSRRMVESWQQRKSER